MTHKDARELARHIQSTGTDVGSLGIACTVPNGYGPDGYFARIWSARDVDADGEPSYGPARPVDFHSREEWDAWQRETVRQRLLSQPRSPLDIMIDRAVGLE